MVFQLPGNISLLHVTAGAGPFVDIRKIPIVGKLLADQQAFFVIVLEKNATGFVDDLSHQYP
jgi:hypothetical protein